jgi:hypothetical protein
VQETPACVIATAVPATVTVAVRALAEALAATVATIVQLPVPPEWESVTQDWPEAAVNAHPDCVVTIRLTVSPPAGTEAEVGATL